MHSHTASTHSSYRLTCRSPLPCVHCFHTTTISSPTLAIAPRLLVHPSLVLQQQYSSSTLVPSALSSGHVGSAPIQPCGCSSVAAPHPFSISKRTGLGPDVVVHKTADTSLSPSPPPPSRPPGEEDEFRLNFGEAVEVLRQDLPCLFDQDPRFHIFRDDITFRTPSLSYLTGLWKYRVMHRAARYLGNLLYADVQLNVARMWQPAGTNKQLRVRWCVSGRPRLSIGEGSAPQSTEGISTYTFDSSGKIYEHQVDNIIPPESMMLRFFEWMMRRLQPDMALQPQLPLPGLRDGMGSIRD